MNKNAIILLLSVTILVGNLTAQLPGFKAYTLQDGLAGHPVRRIFQDKKGFIWIGTWEGLSKFDGYRFTNFTKANGLSFQLVNDLYQTPDGKILVALNNGLTQAIVNDKIQSEAIVQNSTIERFGQTAKGEIVALSDRLGILKLRHGKLEPGSIPMNLPDGSILPITDSLFLVSSPDYGLLLLLNAKFEIIGKYSHAVSAYSLFMDSESRIWAGCFDGLKQVSIDLKSYEIKVTLPPGVFKAPFLQKEQIRCMIEDDRKSFWVGTRTGLVLVEQGGAIRKFTKADGLPDDHIYCLFQDREKNIWIGTAQGVALLANQAKRKYWTTQNGLLNDYVINIVKRGDRYFIGCIDGIQEIRPRSNDGFSFRILAHSNYFLQENGVSAFRVASPYGYVCSIDLENYRLKDSLKYLIPDHGHLVLGSSSDRGSIVLGTSNGVVILRNNKIFVDSLMPRLVSTLFIDDSILWVGTYDSGLYKAKMDEKIEPRLFQQQHFPVMPDSMIRSVYKDSRGILWVGTRHNGVYKISRQPNEDYLVEQFDKERGLISNWIRVITEDKNHNIWLGSSSGVDKLIEGKKGWRIFNFSRFNNLFGVVNSLLADDDGSIWVGMNNGLANIPDAGYDTLPPLPVHITRIQTRLQKDTSLTSGDFPVLALPFRGNAITFDFASPGFINGKEMKYSYRLLSDDDTAWTAPATQQSVSYVSLQPGNYQFEVRNFGWNGEWGLTTSYFFTVRLPFWRTWWFILSVSSVFLLLIYLPYRYRIEQLKRVQQVRNRIATDLHDDIGSTLTNISILTELSMRNSKEPEKAESYLERIREEVDASGQALDDIIWSVNSKNDTLQETAARMRRYAAELFDARNIRYELDMDPLIADQKIMMEQRRDLFLIFKESLNNIHKHASASAVTISLVIEGNFLRLSIIDDGKGFDTARITDRNGIANIKDRARRRKGGVTIQSGNGHGTTIEVRLPLSGITQKGD